MNGDCIRYAEGYKYQLRAPFAKRFPELAGAVLEPVATEWVELDPDGTLRIKAGYAWDGASGPTYDSKSSMRGSLAHDAFYQLMRHRLLDRDRWRAPVDKVFQRLCTEDDMFPPRAWFWFQMVRVFARNATLAASEPQDLCAPCDCIKHAAAKPEVWQEAGG